MNPELVVDLRKSVFDKRLQAFALGPVVRSQLLDLWSGDRVAPQLLDDLVHFNQQLCALCDLIYDVGLLADVVPAVFAEQGAVVANANSVLNAHDFQFAAVVRAQSHIV